MLVVIGAIFILLGTYVSAMNWLCFYKGLIKKDKPGSWIPLLGAGLIIIGGNVCFSQEDAKWFYLALLLDWGSLPGILHAIIFHIFRKSGKGLN